MSEIMNMDGSGWDESMFDDITGDKPEIIKRVTFLIDRSGSMDGTTIGTINTVMEELLSELDRNDIRIAVAELDEQVEWKTDAPITISQFGAWERTRSGSFSSLGRAFSQLASRLNSAAWQAQGAKGSRDYFVLFSDGLASDMYQKGLKELTAVPAFRSGRRIVISFSNLENLELLRTFAGSEKHVIHASGSGAVDFVEQAILKMLE